MSLKCAISTDEYDSNNIRKRSRRSPRDGETHERAPEIKDLVNSFDPQLFNLVFPKDYELAIASAVFEIGLKNASPKILMPLMPLNSVLSTEHIKSHLQKYRIHHHRSKDEFQQFYETHIKDDFSHWDKNRGWENSDNVACLTNDSSPTPQYNSTRQPTLSSSSSSARLSNMTASDTQTNCDVANNMRQSDDKSLITTETAAASRAELLRKAQQMITEWRTVYNETSSLLYRVNDGSSETRQAPVEDR